MRDVREWDEDYILFELPVGENDRFDAKSRRGLDLTVDKVEEKNVFANLSKQLSAFANTGGGQLVFGLKDPDIAAGRHFVDDGGVAVTLPKKGDTREWLENVIPNLVDLPLTKFNVYAVTGKKPDSEIEQGRALYVIDIEDSPNAPHQAKDNVYYARVAGRSLPIGHRLVADIMGRRQHPQIELEFMIVINDKPRPDQRFVLNLNKPPDPFAINIIAKNVGRVYAQYVNVSIHLPSDMATEYGRKDAFIDASGELIVAYKETNTRRDPVDAHTHGPSWFDPILPGLMRVWKKPLRDDYDLIDVSERQIQWMAHADNAPPQFGSIKLSEIEIMDQRKQKR